MVTGLYRSQVQRKLAEQGAPITAGQMLWAEMNGFIDPPLRDGINNRVYTSKHVEQLLAYVRSPKRRGRLSVHALA